MKNFEDKFYIKGNLEKALKIQKILSKLPDDTFPAGTHFDVELIEEQQIPIVKISYSVKDNIKEINIPSPSRYNQSFNKKEINFEYEENSYRLSILE
jgi:hypothetical protein